MGSRAVAHRGADRGIGNSDGENPINLLARQQRHHLTEKKKKGIDGRFSEFKSAMRDSSEVEAYKGDR